MDLDNRAGIDCGNGVGEVGQGREMVENWDNFSKTTIRKELTS